MCLFFYTYIGDYMTIYLDLVMILNFTIDFILLLTVSLILKRNIKITRIMLGSFFGGISILFLFFNMNNIILFLLKLIISILMIIITFKFVNLKYNQTFDIIYPLIFLAVISCTEYSRSHSNDIGTAAYSRFIISAHAERKMIHFCIFYFSRRNMIEDLNYSSEIFKFQFKHLF